MNFIDLVLVLFLLNLPIAGFDNRVKRLCKFLELSGTNRTFKEDANFNSQVSKKRLEIRPDRRNCKNMIRPKRDTKHSARFKKDENKPSWQGESLVFSVIYQKTSSMERISKAPSTPYTATTEKAFDEASTDVLDFHTQHNKHYKPIYATETSLLKCPYLVHVAVKIDKRLDFICMGTIISNKHVISAASKFYDSEDNHVFPMNYVIGFGPQDRIDLLHNVEAIFIHPAFWYVTTATDAYDLSILKVKYEINFNEKVKPISLPRSGMKVELMRLQKQYGSCNMSSLTLKKSTNEKLELTFKVNLVNIEECKYLAKHIDRDYIISEGIHICTLNSGFKDFEFGSDGTGLIHGSEIWGVATKIKGRVEDDLLQVFTRLDTSERFIMMALRSGKRRTGVALSVSSLWHRLSLVIFVSMYPRVDYYRII